MIQEAIIRYLRKHRQESLSPKAVLFDMDGVLYDSMRFHARAWHEVATLHQLTSRPEDFYMFEGRTGESTINELYQRTFQRDATAEEKQTIYKEKADFYIELNPVWDEYLHTHYKILMDFTYWNLMQFLQARNPNVPAISSKLIRPESRSSLANQHRYWNKVIQIGGPVRCIYTGHELYPSDYELDHFIPWSFVSHDLLWNLIPADGSINSSKSNYLPDLDIYLPKLAKLQHHSLKVSIQANYQPTILEDFLSLGYTPKEFVLMNEEEFLEVYRRTFGPMHQIALNMGFETWKY